MHARIHSFSKTLCAKDLDGTMGLGQYETKGYVEALCSLNTVTDLRTLRWAKAEIVNAEGMKGIVLVKEQAIIKNKSAELVVWRVKDPKVVFGTIVSKYKDDLGFGRDAGIQEERIDRMKREKKLHVGRNTIIHQGVYLEEGVVIGDNCSVGVQGFGISRSTAFN